MSEAGALVSMRGIVKRFGAVEALKRNPDFRDPEQPCLDRFRVVLMPDDATQIAASRSGDIEYYDTNELDGYDIRTVQELLGHRDVSTTQIYTHVLNRGPAGVRSPADRLFNA